jgi:transcriptional regulator with XRE-family HTH domain
MVADTLHQALATTVQVARADRGLSVASLADLSGVSKAMISKIERGEVQPTAALLGKLCAALGMTLSELIARAENDTVRLVRRSDQPVWTDPATGYTRRAVSPPASAALELIEVELPPEAEVRYPAEIYRFVAVQIWVLSGRLRFVEGSQVHELEAGDCLQLGPPSDCAFINPTQAVCRYLVALDTMAAPRHGRPAPAGGFRGYP